MVLDIIIVNHNSRHHLKTCLEAIKNSRNSKNYEVVIFDNASTDTSMPYAQCAFPSFRYIKNTTNIGFAPAINRVLKKTAGEYILLINPDVVILPRTIDLMLQFMRQSPKCGVLGGEILNARGVFQPTCRRFPQYYNVIFGRRSLARRLIPHNLGSRRYLYLDLDYTKPQMVNFVEGSLMMIRRKAAEDIGLFDEDFFLYLEDADFCYRLDQQGWETWWLPKAYGIHFRGENFRSDNIHPMFYHSRGFYKFFLKHYRPGAIAKLFLHLFLILRLSYIVSTESVRKNVR